MRQVPLCLLLCFALIGCQEEEASSESALPVTVLTLEVSTPGLSDRATGVVTPYRESDVGFEVSGRVEFVRDVGSEVEGPVRDYDGKLVRPGDVIAAIDSTRYAQSVRSLDLKITAEIANLTAQRIDLEQIGKADVQSARSKVDADAQAVKAGDAAANAAKADRVLARQTYDRQLRLFKKGAVSAQQRDEAKNKLDATTARENQAIAEFETRKQSLAVSKAGLASALAGIELKRAKLKGTEAKISELRENLKTAELDLADCTLRAPYSGRITQLHVTRGGFVTRNAPALTLTLLDPIRVQITASADDARRIAYESQMEVFLPGSNKPIYGIVREKSDVADPSTRTFLVAGLVRNVRDHANGGGDDDGEPAEPFGGYGPLLYRHADEPGELYVGRHGLWYDGGKVYVLRHPTLRFATRSAVDPGARFVPEKVEVELGDDYWGLLNYSVRQVKGKKLRHGDMIIRDPKPAHMQGAKLTPHSWHLRPGDLVQVAIQAGKQPTGIYVPVDAIRELNGQTSVFVIEDSKAKRVAVTVHESADNLRRVEGDGIEPGVEIAHKGVHYLADGATVAVLKKSGAK